MGLEVHVTVLCRTWPSEITPEAIHDDTIWVNWQSSLVGLRVNKTSVDNTLYGH